MALALAAVTAAAAPPGRERTAKTLQVAEAATGRQPRAAGEAVLLGKAEAMSRCGRGEDSEPSARIRPQLCCQWLQELGANGHGTMQAT